MVISVGEHDGRVGSALTTPRQSRFKTFGTRMEHSLESNGAFGALGAWVPVHKTHGWEASQRTPVSDRPHRRDELWHKQVAPRAWSVGSPAQRAVDTAIKNPPFCFVLAA